MKRFLVFRNGHLMETFKSLNIAYGYALNTKTYENYVWIIDNKKNIKLDLS